MTFLRNGKISIKQILNFLQENKYNYRILNPYMIRTKIDCKCPIADFLSLKSSHDATLNQNTDKIKCCMRFINAADNYLIFELSKRNTEENNRVKILRQKILEVLEL